MQRRRFLRGAGGVALAAPFLSSVASKSVRAQASAPRRLVIFHTPNGCLTKRWFPSVEDGPLAASSLLGTTLESLTPSVDKLLFPRGLQMYPSGTINGYFDPDDQAMGSKLTAAPIDAGGKHYALGRSLDHVVAELINPGANSPLVVSPGRVSSDAKAVLSYSAPLEPYLPTTNPAEIYADLTGIVDGEAAYQVARGNSVIDAVRDDLGSYQRLAMSRADQLKIDDWLDLLRDTEREMMPGACSSELAATLGITQARLARVSPPELTTFSEGGDMLINLIALTMMCDANRSIILQWSPFVTFNWDGIEHDYDHAGLSHRTGNASVGGLCLEGALGMIWEIDRWYAGRYARLVNLVDSVSEGEGTMLDNSALVWLPEFADGMAHNVNNLPIVIAGSCGGYLKQGVSVNLEDEPLGTGGSEVPCEPGEIISFEGGSTTGRVPLNKLYVTLLNALGATDSGASFTEFGQVDSNDIEAGITSPGELDALKATI